MGGVNNKMPVTIDTFVKKMFQYGSAKKQSFAKHPFGDFIRNTATGLFKELVKDPKFEFEVKGSVGQGKWAEIPWLLIRNDAVSEGTQEGIYIVYLLSSDNKRLYLTLNQGCQKLQDNIKNTEEVVKVLRANAKKVTDNINCQGFNTDESVSLNDHGLGFFYQKGVICYKKYECTKIPDEKTLESDLMRMLQVYKNYIKSGIQISTNITTLVGNNMNKNFEMEKYAKNLILYGPPGTGKTYNSVIYAVAVCEQTTVEALKKERYSEILRRYREYTEEGRIAFTTFHQSYGYEEFIEGIKPKLSSDNSDSLDYVLEDGLFKKFCLRAKNSTLNYDGVTIPVNSKIWGMFLGGSGNSSVKTECFQNNEIRLGFSDISDDNLDDPEINSSKKRMITAFIDVMEIGDLVLIAENTKSIDAIGIITGNYEYDQSREDFARKRKVEWLIKNEHHDITEILPEDRKPMPRSTIFSLDYLKKEDILSLVPDFQKFEPDTRPRVFIIDEINRGNISKIFGELITLIEESKREGGTEEMHAILPYSKNDFSVPKNVFILGTMNTADRSIALIDTALRRRFDFEEMLPDTKVLDSLGIGIISFDDQVELDLSKMLETINNRIAYLYDREHTIGHAFFTKLALKQNYNIETLAEIFRKKIIPLLQEYFYDDYEKIQLVLGDNDDKKPRANQFIVAADINNSTFRGNASIDLPNKSYTINNEAFTDIDSYRWIYEEKQTNNN